MQPYKNVHGDSGVVAFAIGKDAITIRFKDGGTYLYNYASPGKAHVENMKLLAKQGEGLATYINTHVRERYAAKLG